MKKRVLIGAIMGAAIAVSAMSARQPEIGLAAGTRTSFNEGWKFIKGDAAGAEKIVFDDSSWRELDLPHDWAIEGPFNVKYNARCGGLPFHGIGWYRKAFTVPAEAKGKVVKVTFDGAMYNAHVWINGHFLGNRPYGYIEFEHDLSAYLNYGGDNVIAVKLMPEDLSSRWYPGAGIYRNVWLDIRNPVHVAQWGTFVTTPDVSADQATVNVKTTLVGQGAVEYEIFDPKGRKVAASTTPSMTVDNPELWDLDHPNLYVLRTTVRSGGAMVDQVKTRFGIRTLKFTKQGFWLNGKKTRIQGVCLHHDNGPIGAAVNRRADQRKLQIMKKMGVNSIRTSHNPPSNEFLDLCDELGILVQVEAFDVWKMPKVPNGYNKFFDEWGERDMKDMVRRDRNHPSVFMWSIGNEIIEQSKPADVGLNLARKLNDYVKELDTTRPTTCGFNHWPGPYQGGMAAQVDIAGMNYKPLAYGAQVDEFLPNNPVIGSETSSCTSSRGVYHLPIEKYKNHPSRQVTSYDLIGPPWAYPPDVEFYQQKLHPEILGEYMWTGFDYLGEPTPYGGKDNSTDGYWNADWPARSSYFGAVDLCGLPKDRFYLYQSQWTTEPMIHLLPHWNWIGTPHETIPVYAYTNCEEAELFVNGKSMGRRVKGKDLTKLLVKFNHYDKDYFMSPYRLSWDVPYEPGAIKVVGYINGKAVEEQEVKTAGRPAKISLVPDRKTLAADGCDLSYVTVRIEDAAGNLCPRADNNVKFIVEGAGSIAAVGNGNAATTAPFIASQRDAFSGLCMLIVKSGKQDGTIRVEAYSEGLHSARVSLKVK